MIRTAKVDVSMNLPYEFTQTIRSVFGADGERWLVDLPNLIAEASQRWALTDIQPVSNLSYNFVAFASRSERSEVHTRPGGRCQGLKSNVVLKIGVPNRELTSEIATLTYFNGEGAVRILDSDAEKGMFLLERITPGRMLATVMDDDLATHIAADVMINLWSRSDAFAKHPVKGNRYTATEVTTTAFIPLTDWFDSLKRIRPHFDGGTGPFPSHLLKKAEALLPELFTAPNVLLHGDFHHYNILESERGWLVIDPKGVIGPKGYEMGPLLTNPFERFVKGGLPQARTEQRIAILAEKTGLERCIIRDWGLCHAILSAWWSIEDGEPGWGEYSLRCAEIINDVKI